jgi:exodeoxyribonuclease VII large subunit
MDDRRILTVSELNSAIRSLLEGRFPFVSVVGEISNLHRPHSGHLYFTLKDTGAQIKAVLFKMQQRYLAELPADGVQVVCRGRISVYEPRGDYQLIVDTIEARGAGALQQAFDALKRRLAAEGLFDEHLKRALPPFPSHITLITSPHGAAVHDFIRIATRRFPPIRIAIYPVAVQGEQAATEMIEALAAVNARAATDLIVLCRGGGSVEDLWAFNDEGLARAIRHSELPVVSAVGHEIDVTIADFAADLRAPTPSGAAELLAPDGTALHHRIDGLGMRLARSLHHRLTRIEQRLQLARQRMTTMPHPLDRLLLHLDHLSIRLEHSLTAVLVNKGGRLDRATHHLARFNPQHQYDIQTQRLVDLRHRLTQAGRLLLQAKEEQLGRAAGVLHAVSPLATLARGYALVRTGRGRKHVVTAADQVRTGAEVEVILRRGGLLCRVEERYEEDRLADGNDQSSTASTS